MIYILLLYFIKINQVLENRKPMNQQPKSTPFVCRGRLREGAYSFFSVYDSVHVQNLISEFISLGRVEPLLCTVHLCFVGSCKTRFMI